MLEERLAPVEQCRKRARANMNFVEATASQRSHRLTTEHCTASPTPEDLERVWRIAPQCYQCPLTLTFHVQGQWSFQSSLLCLVLGGPFWQLRFRTAVRAAASEKRVPQCGWILRPRGLCGSTAPTGGPQLAAVETQKRALGLIGIRNRRVTRTPGAALGGAPGGFSPTCGKQCCGLLVTSSERC